MVRTLFLGALVLLSLVTAAMPAAAVEGGAVGVVEAKFGPDCPDGSTVGALVGIEREPGTWLFDLNGVNTAFPGCGDAPGGARQFEGAWDADAGGCMPSILTDAVLGPLYLCLTDPSGSDTIREYGFLLCREQFCNPGTATLVFA